MTFGGVATACTAPNQLVFFGGIALAVSGGLFALSKHDKPDAGLKLSTWAKIGTGAVAGLVANPLLTLNGVVTAAQAWQNANPQQFAFGLCLAIANGIFYPMSNLAVMRNGVATLKTGTAPKTDWNRIAMGFLLGSAMLGAASAIIKDLSLAGIAASFGASAASGFSGRTQPPQSTPG